MVCKIAMLIAGLWVGAKAISLARWYFFTNRNGNSGVGSGHHWSQER